MQLDISVIGSVRLDFGNRFVKMQISELQNKKNYPRNFAQEQQKSVISNLRSQEILGCLNHRNMVKYWNKKVIDNNRDGKINQQK